jgi:hypothetical protein
MHPHGHASEISAKNSVIGGITRVATFPGQGPSHTITPHILLPACAKLEGQSELRSYTAYIPDQYNVFGKAAP